MKSKNPIQKIAGDFCCLADRQGNVKVASNKGKAIYGRRLRHTNITATNNHSKMLEKLLDLDKFGNKNPWSDCCFIRQRQEIDWLYTD
jgi:hypothetical protein